MRRFLGILFLSSAFLGMTYIIDKYTELPVPSKTKTWSDRRPWTPPTANAQTERDGPRSVNLALETSLLFEPKDSYKHLKFIAEARKFLDKLEKAISPHKDALRIGNKNYLTEFLNNLGETLMTFDDEALHQFFVALEFEMRLHYYKGSMFREILFDPKLLTYFRNKLKEWSNADPRMMRAKLSKYMLSDRNKDTSLNRFGKFLNDYYENEQKEVMRDVVEQLRNVEDENELGGIIRDAVNVLVIQHYDRLNYTTRAKLADEINKLNEYTKSDVDEDLKLSFRKFEKDFSGFSDENVNNNKIYKKDKRDKKESNETLVYNLKTDLFVKAIDVEGTVNEIGEGDGDRAKEKDNILRDNGKFFENHED